MSKRDNSHERRPRGWYPTPREAFEPLIQHLDRDRSIVEPCAGDGALCIHLARAGYPPVWALDIEPQHPNVVQRDALDIIREDIADLPPIMFVTNPPWPEPGQNGEPTIMILRHLSSLAPTWLLLPSDFMHNVYAGPAMAFCHKIVSVGRVKWIPGTDKHGYDNCAWYLFDQRQPAASTVIVPRQPKRKAA